MKPKKGYQAGFLMLAQKAKLVKYVENNLDKNQDELTE
jgi:hypothetical protein